MRQNLWPNALAKLCGAALGAGEDKEARRASEKSPPDKTRWDLLRIDTVVSPRRASGGDPSETRFRVAMPSTWTVGRGAHTPPNQAAGITGPAVGIAGQFGRIYNPPLQAYPLPFSVVGAACMAARTAPAGPPGLRAWQPAPGGMWACRPTALAGGAVGIAGLARADIQSAPTDAFAAVSRRRGALYMRPCRTAGFTRPAIIAPRPGGMWACRPTAFDGGTAGIGGLFGRLIAAPTGAPAAVSRRRGGYQPPGPHRRDRRACGHGNPPPAACGHAALRRSTGVRRGSGAFSGG